MPKKTPKTCKYCKSYKPNTHFPQMKAGKCDKGVDFISISAIFDVKEGDRCAKWKKVTNAKPTK